MNVRRSWFFFLVMLVLAACCILFLAAKPITEAVLTLRGTPEHITWQAVGAGSGKTAVAAGWRDGGLLLRFFTTEGKPLSEQAYELPEEMEGATVSQLLPLGDGDAYAGLYGADAEELYLYRFSSGEAERLLALPCVGGSFLDRTSRTQLSEFTSEDGVLSFAVRTDRKIEQYICRGSGGLEPAGTAKCGKNNVLSVFSAENGTLLVGGTGVLTLQAGPGAGLDGGSTSGAPVSGQAVTRLTQARGGWYYFDAVRFDLCFVDSALSATQRMLHLDASWKGTPRSLTSLALTREESALMLLDGTILTVTDSDGTRALGGILYSTASKAWFTLLGYALLTLLAAALLWLLLCGMRRGYASLVVFRGGIFVAAAMVCFSVLYFGYMEPMQRASALRENETLVSGVLRSTRAENRMQDEGLMDDVCRMLEGTGSGRNVRAVLASDAEGTWRTSDGRLAQSDAAFSPALAERARASARASSIDPSRGTGAEKRGGVLRYVLWTEEGCLSIRVEAPYEQDDAFLLRPVLISYIALACVALLVLLSIGLDLGRISRKMEVISRGSVPERLELPTGDELESMATTVNSLGASLKSQEEERESLEHSYRRFVPEKVLDLLGKQSIREVDKSTFAARRMAVMTVWFSFPESLYTDMNNSRLLFDSVNEVIERTASIVSRKGGTVFHFAYNGFDVIMDEGGEAVSTAVAIQQEVLSFNDLRVSDGLPAVTLRIALDKGNVMLGIVGDTAKMEPTTISSSLSTAQELIDLCNRLKAGILCTEAIISEKQEYGNRYMGKCVVGDRPVRVYEVFDGDEFGVRRGKAASMKEFSQGVYDLYSGDAAGAKHRFLQLAHDYPTDGGARYYLYLADKLEHDPSLPCVLNVDSATGGAM